ncbi:hypothetical protein O181_010757 [Austropuccinia psidii MF-1]|uniref:Reverse transcriptase domain-containing protein n=1 Tax=Austropuccinia psidii MF-1 TaxID=1389203 RepID=A0A9Q3GLH9_9BASI|nr:hypothetical protein [Austropuccinia psidii MF-1]
MSELPENVPLFILDSNEPTSLFITHYTKWVVDLPSLPRFEWHLFIINSPKGEDLILGYNFLYHSNPIINWKNGLISYNSSGINSSTCNDFATSVNSVALFGEVKTTSIPSSVHISSIMLSQSLLPSRDEISKEIKDVAISSLYLFQGDMDLPTLSFHASLEEYWDEEEEKEEIEAVLKEGLLPPVGVIYSFSNEESETLQAYISESLGKGFIRPSSSSTGAPVLFVKKKDGCLCFCVDYHKLNDVTRKNRYPVPIMNHPLTAFNGSTIFSKIDLHGAYNLLRIKEGDENLTAFINKYGSYEYLVMAFGLTNDPSSFQNLVNDIFSDFLDIFVVVYLDDIMVLSSEGEPVKHVASVLQILRDNNFLAKASNDGLNIYSSKVQQILNWPQTQNIKALKYFLGFANFYCCFIEYSYKKITALTSLIEKDSPLIFNEEALSKLQILKESFATAPILAYFNPSLPAIIETDASDYALEAVLSQVKESGKHPIEFDSCKLLPAEINHEINDKDLLGLVWHLKCWRAFLLVFLILLKSLQTTLPSNILCLPKFLLVVKPSGLNFSLNSILLLLTAQEDWPLYQIPYHIGTTCTQRGGWTSSEIIMKISIKFSSKMKFMSQDYSQ